MTHHIIDLTVSTPNIASAVVEAVCWGMPARRVASRSHGAVLPHVCSNKMGSSFDAESGGEERSLTLADVLEDVLAFRPQPLEVHWHDGSRLRRSFPDVGVVCLNGSVELWECKPKDVDASLVQKLRPLANALSRCGVGYRVKTPRWFMAEPRLANARRIARQGERPVDPELRDGIEYLLGAGAKTLGELSLGVGTGYAELLGAVARGVFAVCIDDVALGDASPVRPARRAARSGAFLREGQ